VYPTPPMTPRPPAFVTAAASSGPAATFIPVSPGCSVIEARTSVSSHYSPASRIGCSILNISVIGVAILDMVADGGLGDSDNGGGVGVGEGKGGEEGRVYVALVSRSTRKSRLATPRTGV
jgi:hypothetical protein